MSAALSPALSTISDDPNDDVLSYAIAYGNDAGYFSVSNSTGAVTVVVGLDYQATQSLTLLVMISKAKLPAYQTGCTIFINGADENLRIPLAACRTLLRPCLDTVIAVNHAPIVVPQVLFVDESAAAVAGALVGVIGAVDSDNPARTAGSGRPAVFVPPAWYALGYNLSANVFLNGTRVPIFSVNSSTGALVISAPLRWSASQGQFWFSAKFVRATFSLNATVCNPSMPVLCSAAPLTIAVVSNFTAPSSPLIFSLSTPSGGLGTLGGDIVSFQGTQLAVGAVTRAMYCNNATGTCYSSVCTCASAALVTCVTVPGFGSGFVWVVTQNGAALPSAVSLVTQYAAPILGRLGLPRCPHPAIYSTHACVMSFPILQGASHLPRRSL